MQNIKKILCDISDICQCNMQGYMQIHSINFITRGRKQNNLQRNQ